MKDFLSNLLVPISQILTLFSVTIGIIISVRLYRLKVREEIRLSKITQIEADVKLLKLFAETFGIAESRKDTFVSDKIIEELFAKKIITHNDFSDLKNLNGLNEKLGIATRVTSHGLASQISAIVSVGELGLSYEVLRNPALRGLNNLKEQKLPFFEIQDYINKINDLEGKNT